MCSAQTSLEQTFIRSSGLEDISFSLYCRKDRHPRCSEKLGSYQVQIELPIKVCSRRVFALHLKLNRKDAQLYLSTSILKIVRFSARVMSKVAKNHQESNWRYIFCRQCRIQTTRSFIDILLWLNSLVVSALGIRTRVPRFDSRLMPLFH